MVSQLLTSDQKEHIYPEVPLPLSAPLGAPLGAAGGVTTFDLRSKWHVKLFTTLR